MNHVSISEALRELIAETKGESVTVRWLLEALRKRAFGFLLLFLAIPNIIPMPPGLSTIFGVLLLFPSIQMMMGNEQPWFPRAISKHSLRTATLRTVVEKSTPWLERIEPLTHERLTFLADRPFVQVLGAVCLVLALILMLPIFLGNLFPGIAVALIAIGLIERDGVFVLLGLPFVAASLFVTYANFKVIELTIEGVMHFWGVAS